MPVKKTTKPGGPVKYLLSGDRKLQRLSLKKIAHPAKKAKPRARSTRVKLPTEQETAARSPKRISGTVVVVGVACLFAAAALLAARQPAAPPDDASTATAPDAAAASQPSIPVANAHRAPEAIEKSPPLAPVKKTQPAKAVASSTAARESTTPVTSWSMLTVQGCLESEGSTYRLKDVSGLEAPKVRSWRTGFLMKRSSSIALVDTTGKLRLQDRIGTQVAATGFRVEREFRATALRQVAASCR